MPNILRNTPTRFRSPSTTSASSSNEDPSNETGMQKLAMDFASLPTKRLIWQGCHGEASKTTMIRVHEGIFPRSTNRCTTKKQAPTCTSSSVAHVLSVRRDANRTFNATRSLDCLATFVTTSSFRGFGCDVVRRGSRDCFHRKRRAHLRQPFFAFDESERRSTWNALRETSLHRWERW